MNNVDKAKAAYAVERLLDVDELLKDVDPATLFGEDKSWVQRAKREAADAMTIYQTLREGAGKTSSDAWKLAVDSDGIEVYLSSYPHLLLHAHIFPLETHTFRSGTVPTRSNDEIRKRVRRA